MDRRFDIRFVLNTSYAAGFEVHEQVTVESEEGPDMWVISRTAPDLDELVEVYSLDGDSRGTARVVDMRPTVVEGVVRVRIHLRRLSA